MLEAERQKRSCQFQPGWLVQESSLLEEEFLASPGSVEEVVAVEVELEASLEVRQGRLASVSAVEQ